jgi:hypothetical protein
MLLRKEGKRSALFCLDQHKAFDAAVMIVA